MKTVNYYHVLISDGGRYGRAENVFEKIVMNVVAQNDHCFVVDDYSFTTVNKKDSKYSTCLDSEQIGLYSNDSIWGNRITYHLYTEKTVRASTIKKHIEKAVKAKYGFFMGSLDLSIIKDAK